MNLITNALSTTYNYSVQTIKNQDPRLLAYRVAALALGVFLITQDVALPFAMLAVTALSPVTGVIAAGAITTIVASSFLAKAVVTAKFVKFLTVATMFAGPYTFYLAAKKIEHLSLEPQAMKLIGKKESKPAVEDNA